jgi:hypothetical protein
MKHRFIISLFVVAALVLSSGSLALNAQQRGAAKPRTPGPPPANPKDFNGIWSIDNSTISGHRLRAEPLPLQPWAKERYDYIKDPNNINARGRNELNPDYKCFPRGPTAAWQGLDHPMEIIQTPQRTLIIFEWGGEMRRLWTDGRALDPDAPYTWYGQSVGKWEGNTLVVETININEHTWLDRAGHPHTNAMKLTERIWRPEQDRLMVEMTIDDPKAYTMPFKVTMGFDRSKYELEEYVLCEDILIHGKLVP